MVTCHCDNRWSGAQAACARGGKLFKHGILQAGWFRVSYFRCGDRSLRSVSLQALGFGSSFAVLYTYVTVSASVFTTYLQQVISFSCEASGLTSNSVLFQTVCFTKSLRNSISTRAFPIPEGYKCLANRGEARSMKNKVPALKTRPTYLLTYRSHSLHSGIRHKCRQASGKGKQAVKCAT